MRERILVKFKQCRTYILWDNSTLNTPKTAALAVVSDEEEKENGGHGNGEAGPIERPASCSGFCAGVEPKACTEVAGKIAEAAGHER